MSAKKSGQGRYDSGVTRCMFRSEARAHIEYTFVIDRCHSAGGAACKLEDTAALSIPVVSHEIRRT